jgi:hypothetical protein
MPKNRFYPVPSGFYRAGFAGVPAYGGNAAGRFLLREPAGTPGT